MELYEDKNAFKELVSVTSEYFAISKTLVEKDYFLMLFLKSVSRDISGIVFKGGTSLSKCFKLIERFSEDLDLALDLDHCSSSLRKQTILNIRKIANLYPFSLENDNDVKMQTNRKYVKFLVNCPFDKEKSEIKNNLIVELSNLVNCYPFVNGEVCSFIGEFLLEVKRNDLIDKFDLQPFDIKVQSLERTFIDKIFAICDYYMRNESDRNSRHLYDIKQLLGKINIDDKLKSLIAKVRCDRMKNSKCPSASNEISINQKLCEIINSEFYKKDYEQITTKLLFADCKYDEVIKSIEKIVESGVFE